MYTILIKRIPFISLSYFAAYLITLRVKKTSKYGIGEI